MGRERTDEYTMEIEAESAGFADATGIFSGSQLIGGIHGFSPASIKNPVLEDPSYRTDGGTHEGIEGVPHDSISVPVQMPAEGCGGGGAGDGVTPTTTAQAELHAIASGAAPAFLTGSTTSGTPTTTQIIESDDDAHAPDGTYTIMPCTLPSGAIEARGGTYVAGTDTFTALQVYSETPAGGAVTPGGILIRYSQAAGRTAQVRFLGNDAAQHRKLLGAVASRTLAAVTPKTVPTWAWNLKAGGFEDEFSDTRVDPTLDRRTVWAGGKLVLSKFGATAIASPQLLSLEIDDGIEWLPDANGQLGGSAPGIGGWVRGKGTPQFRVIVPHDEAPPAAIGESSFRASKRAGGAAALYQATLTYGAQLGAMWTRYYPKIRLKMWESTTDENELDGQTLTFEPAAGVPELYLDLFW